eukprot:6175868-Pleurochrysis_carterae.AAC.7
MNICADARSVRSTHASGAIGWPESESTSGKPKMASNGRNWSPTLMSACRRRSAERAARLRSDSSHSGSSSLAQQRGMLQRLADAGKAGTMPN